MFISDTAESFQGILDGQSIKLDHPPSFHSAESAARLLGASLTYSKRRRYGAPLLEVVDRHPSLSGAHAGLDFWADHPKPCGSRRRPSDPLAHPSGSLRFYPINLGVLQIVELLRYTNHGTRLAPIATRKGSNRGQRLETTGRPPNTSRAQKPCKTRHFRDFEQA